MTDKWEKARLDYEAGCSQSEIAEKLGVSQQRVSQVAREKGWEKPETPLVSVIADLPSCNVENLGKRTPENMALALEIWAKTGNKTLAGKSVGVTRDTFRRWLQDDADYALLAESTRAQFLASHVDNISKAGQRDWKASSFLLSRDAATKEQYGEAEQKSGPTIVLQISRS